MSEIDDFLESLNHRDTPEELAAKHRKKIVQHLNQVVQYIAELDTNVYAETLPWNHHSKAAVKLCALIEQVFLCGFKRWFWPPFLLG